VVQVYAWGCFKDKDNTSFFHAEIPNLCKKQQSRPMLISSTCERLLTWTVLWEQSSMA
jgi:hypothetical protein